MDKKILLVEDDPRIREIISDYFLADGFDLLQTEDGKTALDIFEANKPDLVILDIMIPGIDGWSVCRRMRKNSDVPIVMLTARADEEDKLLGYDLGADDYVTKPFSPKVLVAKVKIILKRVEGTLGRTEGTVAFNGIELNKLSRTVKVDGRPVELALKEFELLLCFMENRDIVLTREAILSKVWGYDYYGDLRTVDTHVKKLRSKLEEKSTCIATVIGAGYRFEVNRL